MNPDDRALALAARIADGSGIDWPATEASPADANELALLEELRAIASLATLHRTPSARPTDAASSAGTRWGPLTLLSKIGEGHFGCVYAAWDARLQRRVALKLMHAASPATSESPDHAIDEARLLARVRHPNVLTVHGAESIDGQVGIWTEFIEGRTLDALVAECGPMPAEEVVSIGLDLCRALAAVHEAGLLHRDVKAQNVMRETGGRIVLMDFGTGHEVDALPTRAGDLSGTPLYLAPELYAGSRATAESDVYALAVLLFYLLTGQYPVPGRTLDDVRAGHRAGQPVRLREVRPDLPEAFSAAIERGLTADPALRYESGCAFETGLESVRANFTQTGPTVVPAWPRRHRRVAVVALAVVVGALSLAYVTSHRTATRPVAFQPRDWVLVTTFENRTGDPQFNGTLEHALTYELRNSAYVNVVPRERVDDALRLMARPPTTVVNAADGPEVALRDGGIRLVLDGMIERLGAGYAMTVRIIEPHTAATVATDREEALTATAVPAAIRRLSDRIRVGLGETPVTVTQDDQRLEKVTTPSLRALRTYSEAVHASTLERFTEAEALLQSALKEDPGFASAHLRMAWTLQNLGRPRDQVIASARRAVDLINAVTERERYPILGAYYWMTGQNALATGQYEAMATRYPDDAEGIGNLRHLYDLADRRQDAADLMVRIADSRPNDFLARVRAAQALLEAHGIDAAQPQIMQALRLLPTTPDTLDSRDFGLAKSWLLMFPVHALWVQRRATEAAALLGATSVRPELRAGGDWALNILGKLYLALGQLRLAERAYARIGNPGQRAITRSEVALARNDLPAAAAALGPARELMAVSLLVRVGDLSAAERLLRTLPNDNAIHFQWAAEEIAEARGDASRVTQALNHGVPWTRVMTGARAFLYSETLARAAVKVGNTPGAIRVLEDTGALGPNAYANSTQSGFYWMRTQKLLADLYRQTGQIDKARAIERDLLKALAAADDDYPLLLELKARGKE